MDTKKLETWASLLLDTGKRNNLVNFHDTKASTVEIVLPSSEDIFKKVESASSFEIYDPKIQDDEDEDYRDFESAEGEGQEDSKKPEKVKREEYINTYGSRIKKSSQVLLYNANVNPVNALKNIDKKARAYIEETGNNVAYIAFGFIHWKESDYSTQIFRAPILLTPVIFANESAVSPWYIKMTEDDTIVNPTFNYKLQSEQGITLPDYGEETLSEYLEKVKALVGKLGWDVTDECKIGIFSFLKMNMYKDLIKNEENILKNNNVRMLLGESYDSAGMSIEDQEYHLNNPLIELHNVVDADSSQIEAIEMAKAGVSFVLQGPPGTGKSQTITNIIAECINDGKKVLFVSEKQAALNVVFDKLKKAELEEFCLELHSYKTNKKEVIDNLCKTMRASKTVVSNVADAALELKEKSRKELDLYEMELHRKRDVINRSLYQLYEDYASCRKAAEVRVTISEISKKNDAFLNEATNLLGQYVEFIPSIGYRYTDNPWYGYINEDTSYQNIEKVKEAVASLVNLLKEMQGVHEEIKQKYGLDSDSINKLVEARELLHAACESEILTPAFFSNESYTNLKQRIEHLKGLNLQITNAKSRIEAEYDASIYKLDGSDLYKRFTRQFTSAFSRLFDSEYKRLISELRLNRKTGKKPSYRDAVVLAENLSICQQSLEQFSGIHNSIKDLLGAAYTGIGSDWNAIEGEIVTFNKAIKAVDNSGNICSMDNAAYQECRADFGKLSQRISEIIERSNLPTKLLADCFAPDIFDIYNASISDSIKKLGGCLDKLDEIENWYRFYKLYLQLDKYELLEFIDAGIEDKIPVGDFVDSYKRNFFRQWIDVILHTSEVLMRFSRINHDNKVENFNLHDHQQFDISKAQIRARLSKNRPSLDMMAPGSAVSILLREGEKKRKQKSVRALLEEIGDLIQTIKPCFLMSPLSVSTFLTSDNIRFDTVVFDEASQIFPQDAIGAIYRGKQLIVVGDSKQMPPSNFFSTSLDTDVDDEEVGDITDFESILDLCSTSFNQIRLKWHYRSKYESLIAFSNKNFYENDLTTFPSSISDKKWVGVDYYNVAGGTFDRKSRNNRKEAEFIVDLIYRNIEKYPDRSLGVVAFSVSQQDLIDRLLSRRRANDPSKEFFFRRDVKEPFFIKNLETVQGDERDTIIFSVAYAPDSMGNFYHNFGPLNRVGGERRLNVAVTRAKMNVQLVASIHYTDIELTRTGATGARLLREYLDYAENGNIALARAVSVNPYEQYDSPFEEEVCEFLRENGYEVDTQVGCSSFKIDLAIKRPGTSDYFLAIECDGATYHSSKNARDRDRLRQEILESMGWNFYRIWSTDWFRNSSVEKKRLLMAAKEAASGACPQPTNSNEEESTKTEIGADNVFAQEEETKHLKFPVYKEVYLDYLYRSNPNFQDFIREVLETEAPLSEDWLLKRIVWVFRRQKVTNVVWDEYNAKMHGCESKGIIRRNGFLYIDGRKAPMLRVPTNRDTKRDIKDIAPEELAMGMYVFISQNVSIDRAGLFKAMASALEFMRVTENMNEYFESALYLLRNAIQEDDGMISLKQK